MKFPICHTSRILANPPQVRQRIQPNPLYLQKMYLGFRSILHNFTYRKFKFSSSPTELTTNEVAEDGACPNYQNGLIPKSNASSLYHGSSTIEVLPPDWSFIDFISEKSKGSQGRQDVEDSFYAVDVGRIIDLYNSWTAALPNIHPYYAVKCNPDPVLLKVLASLGAGFDCASKNEMKSVLDLGISPDRVVYSTPDKQVSYLKYAALKNVSLMSVDSEEELIKIKKHYPSAQLLIRLMVSTDDGIFNSNTKFGCSLVDAKQILDLAKHLELKVIGTSFHVGTGHYNRIAYDTLYKRFSKVLDMSSEVFEYAAQTGHEFTTVDIGGGFEGNKDFHIEFIEITTKISLCIEEFARKFKDIRVIAEPGHYFACSPYTLAASVINKKKANDGSQMYITTSGMHNSFNSLLIFQTSVFHPKLLKDEKLNSDDSLYKCSIWGPACAPDKIASDLYLPQLNVGDWLYYEDMGGYTLSLNAGFNGFPKPSAYYFIKESYKQLIEKMFPLSRLGL